LYENFKNLSEGELTKKRARIVTQETLYKVSKKINLNDYILLGKSIKSINQKILSDCYESLIAAILLDSNLINAEKFIHQTLLHKIDLYETETNYKGKLIELCEKNNLKKPAFITKKDPEGFKTNLILNQKTYKGKGKNKKLSERNVSKKVLLEINL